MPLDAPTAALRLRRQVKESEKSVARALADTAGLFHSAALARAEVPGAGVSEGQEILLRLHKTIGGLVETSGEMARVHGGLAKIGIEYGVTDSPDCPDDDALFTGATLVEEPSVAA